MASRQLWPGPSVGVAAILRPHRDRASWLLGPALRIETGGSKRDRQSLARRYLEPACKVIRPGQVGLVGQQIQAHP